MDTTIKSKYIYLLNLCVLIFIYNLNIKCDTLKTIGDAIKGCQGSKYCTGVVLTEQDRLSNVCYNFINPFIQNHITFNELRGGLIDYFSRQLKYANWVPEFVDNAILNAAQDGVVKGICGGGQIVKTECRSGSYGYHGCQVNLDFTATYTITVGGSDGGGASIKLQGCIDCWSTSY